MKMMIYVEKLASRLAEEALKSYIEIRSEDYTKMYDPNGEGENRIHSDYREKFKQLKDKYIQIITEYD